MAQYLGEILLRSADNSDLFYQQAVFAATINDETETKLLDDPTYVDGFQADGNESVLLDDAPSLALFPIEIEAGNEVITAVYRDARNQDKQYDVLVYLLTEEIVEL